MWEFIKYLGHLFKIAFWNQDAPLLSIFAWATIIYPIIVWAIPPTKEFVDDKLSAVGRYKLLILYGLILISIIIAAYTSQRNAIDTNSKIAQSEKETLQSRLDASEQHAHDLQSMLDIANRISPEVINSIQYEQLYGNVIGSDSAMDYHQSGSTDDYVLKVFIVPYRYPDIKVISWQLNILDVGLVLPMKNAVFLGGGQMSNGMFVITSTPSHMNVYFECMESGLSGEHLVQLIAVTENEEKLSSVQFTIDFLVR